MDRVAFTIFGIDVMWYGVLIATGMLIGFALAIREAKRVGISEDDVLNIAIIAIPVAICARLYYVIFSWDYYSQNPGEIFNIRGGGSCNPRWSYRWNSYRIYICKGKKIRLLQNSRCSYGWYATCTGYRRWGTLW